MILSTTSGAFQLSKNNNRSIPLLKQIQLCHEAGYNCIDIGFCQHFKPEYSLRQENWEQIIDEVGEYAAKEGIQFYQGHTPFVKACCFDYDDNDSDPGYRDYFREVFRRSFIAAGKLGVKWMVIHPLTCPEVNFETAASIEKNHQFYDEFIELGVKNGVGTAYENMLPYCQRQHPRKFCEHYEQLVEFVDSYNDPMVGICYDTGHGNQAGFEVGRAIRYVGKRLKALHINDNIYGALDEHLMPFMGEVDWYSFADALVDAGYEGTMNYEAHKMCTDAPAGEMQMMYAKLMHANGEFLLKIYNEALAKKEGK